MSVSEIYWLAMLVVGLVTYLEASRKLDKGTYYPGTETVDVMISAGIGHIAALIVIGLITAIVFLTGIAARYNIYIPMP